jgi:peptide/nickel transport system permease protein
LIALTTVLAIWGQDLAPRDPLDRSSQLIRIDGAWELAPFPPGTPGFPLGSDQGGRDILSRLLWAIRPTMQLVLIVALIRLGVGILVGVVSGAGRGRLALLLETLTTAALAVPSLLIALVIVLKLWPTWGGPAGSPGLRAFIIGLSITGWAETAQIVREATRVLLGHQYIEAARSLGGSALHLFRRHVLPHLMPLVWIQMAFEVGATLMLVAGMGFLGLYIGGTAPPMEGDPFTLAAAPELGEMLSTSINVIIEPWGMVAAGGVVFLTVLGFNLVGQGLRLRLARALPKQETVFSRAGFWVEEYVTHPIRILAVGVLRWPLRIAAAAIVLAAVIRVAIDLAPAVENQVGQLPTQVEQALAPLPTPTGSPEPSASPLLWNFESPAGAPVPPLIASDGSIYLLTHEDQLYAFAPDGVLRWQHSLDPEPYKARLSQSIGIAIAPLELSGGSIGIVSAGSVYALGTDGERIWESELDAPPGDAGCCAFAPSLSRINLVDSDGSLYAIGPAGERLWKLEPQEGSVTPESAPVIAADGRVFFAVRSGSDVLLNAVSAEGDLLWQSAVPRDRFRQGFVGANEFRWLSLSPTGEYVFLSGDAYQSETGEWVDFDLESAVAEIDAQLEAENAWITCRVSRLASTTSLWDARG